MIKLSKKERKRPRREKERDREKGYLQRRSKAYSAFVYALGLCWGVVGPLVFSATFTFVVVTARIVVVGVRLYACCSYHRVICLIDCLARVFMKFIRLITSADWLSHIYLFKLLIIRTTKILKSFII